MASYYVYFISTLPALHFLAKPPLSSEKFFSLAERFIPNRDIEMLKKCSITGEYAAANIQPTLKKWQNFDTALRNELVKARSAHKHIDPSKYLRQDKYFEASIGHMAVAVHRSPSVLAAEKTLDEQRWRWLDEFAIGHYFDLDFLIVYLLKLLILERWEKVNTADKPKVIEEALKAA